MIHVEMPESVVFYDSYDRKVLSTKYEDRRREVCQLTLQQLHAMFPEFKECTLILDTHKFQVRT